MEAPALLGRAAAVSGESAVGRFQWLLKLVGTDTSGLTFGGTTLAVRFWMYKVPCNGVFEGVLGTRYCISERFT